MCKQGIYLKFSKQEGVNTYVYRFWKQVTSTKKDA